MTQALKAVPEGAQSGAPSSTAKDVCAEIGVYAGGEEDWERGSSRPSVERKRKASRRGSACDEVFDGIGDTDGDGDGRRKWKKENGR